MVYTLKVRWEYLVWESGSSCCCFCGCCCWWRWCTIYREWSIVYLLTKREINLDFIWTREKISEGIIRDERKKENGKYIWYWNFLLIHLFYFHLPPPPPPPPLSAPIPVSLPPPRVPVIHSSTCESLSSLFHFYSSSIVFFVSHPFRISWPSSLFHLLSSHFLTPSQSSISTLIEVLQAGDGCSASSAERILLMEMYGKTGDR